MSEMFTKCNGFIVSGDPLVYADSATMTGQGTVSEPFGVKSTDLFVQEPLYTGVSGNSAYIGWNNETVLWSGTPVTNSTGTLSEPVWNFERFKMYINSLQGGDYVCELSPTGTDESRNYLTYGPRGNNECSLDICKWTFTENTFSAISAKTFQSNWTSTSIAVLNNQAAAKGYVSKIVGINRKV